jgi:hypothetical protein
VLPGVRLANIPNCGGSGLNFCAYHPATLYIDMDNAGAQFYIENALRSLLNGYPPCTDPSGCPIPQDRNWDRYDYLDSHTNWNAPFARGSIAGSNNGMTLDQIEGYRTILCSAGSRGPAPRGRGRLATVRSMARHTRLQRQRQPTDPRGERGQGRRTLDRPPAERAPVPEQHVGRDPPL